MTYPTGSLSVVAERMQAARRDELFIEPMVANQCWNTAVLLKSTAEAYKQQAGVEFILWMLAVLKMPVEPTAQEIADGYASRKAAK